MANPQRQPFFPSGDFVARKPFTMQGVDYKPGDDFDWEKLGLSERKAQSMYNAHFIMDRPKPNKPVKGGPKPKPDDEDEDEGLEKEEEPDNDENEQGDESGKKRKEAKAARAKARADVRKKKKK